MFIERLDDNKSVKVSINDDAIEDVLKYQGYTVYLSDQDIDIMTCHRCYICRDAVEKSFHNYKLDLNLDSAYMHSSQNLDSELFVYMVAQSIYFSVHNILCDNDL
jgi:hypothetical protein